jgi:RNA recognition motif-containing protein
VRTIRFQGASLLPAIMSSSSNQPNTTLYLNNLNDKVNKEELKSQLFALFTTYGKIIDVVASKNQKMRGQAFLVFTDLAGATSAMRACEGMVFYDKPLVSISKKRDIEGLVAHSRCQSTLITQNQNPMQLFETRTPNLFLPLPRMRALF